MVTFGSDIPAGWRLGDHGRNKGTMPYGSLRVPANLLRPEVPDQPGGQEAGGGSAAD
jgi:hypothetical protein